MNIKRVLDEAASNLMIEKPVIKILKEESKRVVSILKEELKKSKVSAEVFIGGSFAKNTLIKGEFYDVDIFVRFDWRYEKLSEILERVLEKIAKKNKLKLESLHGSRDYFRIIIRDNIIFEIVPVVKIKKPKEARNVTDLSYFHVNYVKNKIRKGNLSREIVLAKQFCKARKIYGAESYVNGFSGYAIECLIINYKSFEKMLKELVKVKIGERIVIDSAKHYKKKEDVLFEMNESKLGSPIILVDPTWKERNALAALSRETFERFQDAAKKFLKHPSKEFFVIRKFDIQSFKNNARKSNAELVKIEITTNKQPGDIAGTKMKKFSSYLEKELRRYFDILEKEFEYSGENSAKLYLSAKSKGEIIRTGPPKDFEAHAKSFRKANKNVFEKNGVLHARVKINFTAKKFISDFLKKYNKTIKSMGITGLELINSAEASRLLKSRQLLLRGNL
ncbi:nucleotidyltransferase domain-containing protein [Candidatus Pacearchaeota archaeon]|nr:nucleotidyltransferase domain-containing protein [Candidatus Pacearchaeota archaeon]